MIFFYTDPGLQCMRRDERKHDHADSEDRRTPDRREHDDEK